MKPLLLTLAAIVAVGPLTVAAGDALADPKSDRGGGRGRIEREERRFERRYDERRYERQERRMERRLPPGRELRPEARGRYAAPPGWRRGAYLPPAYRGERIYAFDRHRLRPPPAGYAWYRVGNDYLLTQMVSGLVVEVVQD